MGEASPSDPAILADRYEVLGPLGAGGMGAVLAARDRTTGRRVALKRLLPSLVGNAEVVERFLREARAVAKLHNKHVAEVYEAGVLEDGCPYIAMELLEGQDLRKLVRREGPIPASEAAAYVCQACVALAEAHRVGIIHRDLKPANLFLTTRADGGALVKVLDFGVAKFLEPDIVGGALHMTRAGALVGSRDYMAPEQLLEPSQVDVRADVWSLGVALYYLVSGQMPFRGAAPDDVVAAICIQAPASLAEASPALPDGFESVVLRCLEKRREDRFASVTALARALAPFAKSSARVSVTSTLPQRTTPPPDTSEVRTRAPRGARRAGSAWMVLLALLVVGAVVAAAAWIGR